MTDLRVVAYKLTGLRSADKKAGAGLRLAKL